MMRSNIYELLGEEDSHVKKVAAPAAKGAASASAPAAKGAAAAAGAKGNNAAAPANKAAPSAGNNKANASKAPAAGGNKGNASKAPSADQSKENSRGGQGRGQGRGRGGQGRGGRGAGASGDNNNNNAGEVERSGDAPRNNGTRDRERRQRDQAQRRGDYGAPDQEGHVKRPFDKFSHSAASRYREGGRDKKGGHGPRNWGTKDTSTDAPLDASGDHAEENEKNENTHVEDAGASAEGGDEGKAAEESKQEEVEEAKEVDFQTFLERKRKEEEETNQLISVEIRKVQADDYKDLKPLSRDDEDFFPIDSKKKAAAAAAAKKSGAQNKVNVDEVLDVHAAPAPRDDRRGGRGRGKQDRSRQSKRGQVSLSLHDDNDFPSLAVKA